jgi:hypothetical protein
MRWLVAAGGVAENEMAAAEHALLVPYVRRAQAGQIADLDYVADVIYRRAAKPAGDTASRRVAVASTSPAR